MYVLVEIEDSCDYTTGNTEILSVRCVAVHEDVVDILSYVLDKYNVAYNDLQDLEKYMECYDVLSKEGDMVNLIIQEVTNE